MQLRKAEILEFTLLGNIGRRRTLSNLNITFFEGLNVRHKQKVFLMQNTRNSRHDPQQRSLSLAPFHLAPSRHFPPMWLAQEMLRERNAPLVPRLRMCLAGTSCTATGHAKGMGR